MANPLGLTADQIDELERMGQLTPETANQMRAFAQEGNLQAGVEQFQLGQQSPPPVEQPSISGALRESVGAIGDWLMSPSEQPPSMQVQPTQPQAIETTVPQVESLDQVSEAIPAQEEFLPPPALQNAGREANPRLDAMERGFVRQQQAALKVADAQANLAEETASALRAHQENAEKLEAERIQREQERQAQFEKEIREYEQISERLLDQKIDPNRFWNSRSTGQKIMAGIGIILGGIGAGMTGSNQNLALEIINRAIDADIDAQKAELEKLKSVGGMKQNILSIMRNRFQDERQAEAAAKAFGLDQTMVQLKEIAARNKSPEVRANAEAAIGQLEVAKQKLAIEFESASKAKHVMLRGGELLPAGMDTEDLDKDQRERYVPGLGIALTKEDATELKKSGASTYDIIDLIGRLKEIGKKGFKSVNPVERAKADALLNMIAGKLRVPLTGGGPLTEEERAMLRATVGNPAKLFTLDNIQMEKLDQIEGVMRDSRKRVIEAYGLISPEKRISTFQKR